jgi:hypothetical protein
MTKVQLQFKLVKPLDEKAMENLADTSSLYGILRLKLSPAQDALTVEFDATRLKERDVEAALARAGVSVVPAI